MGKAMTCQDKLDTVSAFKKYTSPLFGLQLLFWITSNIKKKFFVFKYLLGDLIFKVQKYSKLQNIWKISLAVLLDV